MKIQNCEFWGSKLKNIKYWRWPDCSTLNFTPFGVYGLCFSSNVHILEACKHLPLFDPKSRNMTSLKRNVLKNFSTDFSEILSKEVILMPEKVLKVSRRYLLSFLSYRVNTGGRGNISPPPSAALDNGLTFSHLNKNCSRGIYLLAFKAVGCIYYIFYKQVTAGRNISMQNVVFQGL